MKAYIKATGAFVPERIVSNEEISPVLGLTPERIYRSSGIRNRRWALAGTRTSSMAAKALSCAFASASLRPESVDFLLLGTMTPDRFIPGTAPAVQRELALEQIPCLDIHATCCNTLYGLQIARSMIMAGTAKKIALCFAEIQSAWLDLSPSAGTTSMLFGDGASALVVSGHESKGALEIVDLHLSTDGGYIDDLGVRCPGTEFGNASRGVWSIADYLPRMNGHKVLLRASRSMAAVCRVMLERHRLDAEKVAWIVPHQANLNVLKQLLRALGLSRNSDKLVSVIEEYGNTSSASMGIALDSLRRSGRMCHGDYVLMPAFGAGFTWGAALCRMV